MPENLQPLKIYPYDGQKDSARPPLLVSPKDIIDANNIVYSTYSTKKIRPGLTKILKHSGVIYGAIDFWRLGVQKIVFYNGTGLFAYDPLRDVIDDISGNAEIPADESVSFEIFAGLLCIFFTGGATAPLKWTGSGSVSILSATAPNAAFGRKFLNKLWIPDPTIPGRILGSKTNDPTDFTSGDALSLDLDVNDGDPDGITALHKPLDGIMYVSKRLSTYKVVPTYLGEDLVFAPRFVCDFGCISHNGSVGVEYSIMFPSDRGVHVISSSDKVSGIDTSFLSYPIQPDWVKNINFTRSHRIQAVFDIELNSYLLIYPFGGATKSNYLTGYSIAAGKWYDWKSYNQSCIFRYVDLATKKRRTGVGNANGLIGYINTEVYTDYNVPYKLSITSGIICPAGSPYERFQLKEVMPVFKPQNSGSFTISIKMDGKIVDQLQFDMTAGNTSELLGVDFVLGQSILGGVPEVAAELQTASGEGVFVQFFIDYEPEKDAPTDFEILGIILGFDESERKTETVVA